MSNIDWTHPMCEHCYASYEPGRDPLKLTERHYEPCCFCGRMTQDGIYYRYDPKALKCKGIHHAEEQFA